VIHSDTKGAFQIENLPHGTYGIRLSDLPSDAYVAGIRNSEERVAEDSNFGVGNTPLGPLELEIAQDGASLDGTALNDDGTPAARAVVVLAPPTALRANLNLYREVKTDALGHFSIHGIAPGDYTLFAWKSIPSGAGETPEFIRPYDAAGKAVSFTARSSQTIRTMVIP
jgi:hypothetical protein